MSIEAIEKFDFFFKTEVNGTGHKRTPNEREKLEEMLSEAKRFLIEMWTGAEPRWLTICGRSGVGKSHLARRIADFLRKQAEWIYLDTVFLRKSEHSRTYLDGYGYAQEKGIFTRWADLVKSSRDGDYYPFNRACLDWCKVVDDIGAAGFSSEKREGAAVLTPFVLEKLGELCDSRLRKWTVLTSNYNRKQIGEQFDVRIASRLARDGNVIVECNVRDFNSKPSSTEIP